MIITSAFCLAFVLASGVPPAKIPELAVAIDQGRDALRTGEHAKAEEQLVRAVEDAHRRGDDISEARGLFFLALSKQQRAEKTKGEEADALRREALAVYERSRRLYPAASAVLFNMAELQDALGDRPAAKTTLRDAIDLADVKRPVYLVALAQLEEKDGAFAAAADLYLRALESDDHPPGIERKLIDAALASGRDASGLVAPLWKMQQHTDGIEESLGGSMRLLAKGVEDEQTRDALFGIVAAAMARQNYTLSQLADSGIATKLQALDAKPQSSDRVRAIIALYSGEVADRAPFLRWPESIDRADVPPDLKPRRALSDIAVGLGRRALNERRPEIAEPFLLLARDLGRADDAGIARDLAKVYVLTRRTGELPKFAATFEGVLYGDPAALQRNRLEDVYDYHLTLGRIFASSGSNADALAELTRAVGVAEELRRNTADQAAPFEIEAAVLRLLESVKVKTLVAR